MVFKDNLSPRDDEKDKIIQSTVDSIYRILAYEKEFLVNHAVSAFREVAYVLDGLHKYLLPIVAEPEYLESLNFRGLKALNLEFRRFLRALEAIYNFRENPKDLLSFSAEQEIQQQLIKSYDNIYDAIIVPYLRYRQSALVSTLEKNTAQSQEILVHQKKASGQIAANSFAGIFEKEALRHNASKKIWVWLSVSFAIALSGLIWWALEPLISYTGKDDYIHVLVAKFLIISFTSLAYYQIFIRNLNASRHLCAVNKHRANILRTYESLIDSANSNESKDAILLQTTKAIYDMGETGYVSSKDSNNPYEVASLMEMLNRK